MTTRIVPVGSLATYLRDLVESDEVLQDLWVEGEVTSFTVAASGHAYFTIRDDLAAIDCVMWRANRLRQTFQPAAGEKVFVHGRATVYERATRLQVQADVLHPAGAGLLQLQLEQLRQRLEAEGLFEPERKRPLPRFPQRIGVVTSTMGAVWHDIQRVLGRRYPLAELVLSSASMQGDAAPESVVDALRRVQEAGVDLVILARGGGSAEDLAAFNDERIARAIFACRVPVISAIGHETDTCIADMVADLRASTPSVAAELAAPDIAELAESILELTARSRTAVAGMVDRRRHGLESLQHRLLVASPSAQLAAMRVSLDAISARVQASAGYALERKAHECDRAAALLSALDPHAMMRRGFAHVVRASDESAVRRAADVTPGDHITVQFIDGHIHASVDDIRPAMS